MPLVIHLALGNLLTATDQNNRCFCPIFLTIKNAGIFEENGLFLYCCCVGDVVFHLQNLLKYIK